MKAATGAECDVYWAPLGALKASDLVLLDDVEVTRCERYARQEDRARFAVAAVLLRAVVAARCGVSPQGVRVDRTCATCGQPHGRPRVPDEDIELSVSHSGDFVAVAASTAGPVGIDLEVIRPLDHAPLLDHVCAPEERDEVTSAPAFYAYWTRKESVLKATGEGLMLAMHTLLVTPPTQPPRLLRYRSSLPLSARMIDVSPARDYAGAVTVLSEEPVVFRSHDGAELLRACS